MNSKMQLLLADRFLFAFNLSSVGNVVLPLLVFGLARLTTNDGEDDDQQENENQYDEYGNYNGQSRWWQFWKSNNNYNENGDQSEDEQGSPWWCKFTIR
jgi:hypothetical protein